jgi:DNA-binding HxlR family transcriptional regulator
VVLAKCKYNDKTQCLRFASADSTMKEAKRRSDCPIAFALDIFGDKWSLLIIRDLMFKSIRNYRGFLGSEEGIATNILADRLEMLECAGLIVGREDESNKSRHLYSLTEKAIDLVPAILEIVRWSADHDSQTGAPKEFVDRVKNDRDNFVREIQQQLRAQYGGER